MAEFAPLHFQDYINLGALHFTRPGPHKYCVHECVSKAQSGRWCGISCIYKIGSKDVLSQVL